MHFVICLSLSVIPLSNNPWASHSHPHAHAESVAPAGCFWCSYSFAFFQNVIGLESCGTLPFKPGFLHLIMSIHISSMFFSLIEISFLSITDYFSIALVYWCLSVHLLRNVLVPPTFWQLWIKLQKTFMCRFLCGYKFSLWINIWECDCW